MDCQGSADQKIAIYWLLTFFFCLLLAFFATEYSLRRQAAAVRASDRQDPGLIRYDAELGWRLAPDWRGGHRHQDYSVRYATDSAGRRADYAADKTDDAPFTAVVGDSFTFGLGVNDDETFVAYCNQMPGAGSFRNYGVPGYSTDQELLYLQRHILPQRPREVLLVVYLGNDIFDNTLPFPLQASHAKPFFTLSGAVLTLNNQPVPLLRKPKSDFRQEMEAFLPPRPMPQAFALLASRSLVVSGLVNRLAPLPRDFNFPPKLDEALKLFGALMTRTQQSCQHNGTSLRLALLGGAVTVLEPSSLSTRVQDHLRAGILQMARQQKIPVIDLVAAMRDTPASAGTKKSWYHPNEGHLTAAGHRVLAALLTQGR